MSNHKMVKDTGKFGAATNAWPYGRSGNLGEANLDTNAQKQKRDCSAVWCRRNEFKSYARKLLKELF